MYIDEVTDRKHNYGNIVRSQLSTKGMREPREDGGETGRAQVLETILHKDERMGGQHN